MRSAVVLSIALGALAGCKHAGSPEASPDASPDAATEDPEPAPIAGCDYVQRHHHDSTSSIETLPFSFTGKPFTICGAIDPPPADDPLGSIMRTFEVGSATTQSFVAHVETDTPVTYFDYEHDVDGVFFYASPSTELHVDTTHDVVFGFIRGGQVTQFSANSTTGYKFTAPIHFKATISPFSAKAQCPQPNTPVDYTEAHDTATSKGNDVFEFSGATADATDAPESTGLTIDNATPRRIDGTLASVAPAEHTRTRDRDTFQITTGPDTHVLYVRPTPSSSDNSFVYLRLATTDLADIQNSGDERNGQNLAGGLGIFVVKPSTTYWLQIDGSDSSNVNDFPRNYDLSVCGSAGPL
jgi:hypothetical protein